jgi:plastocyanin
VGIDRRVKFALAGLLGAAVVVLPAAAGSETTPTVMAENVGIYNHYWTPSSIDVEPGQSVDIANPTTVPHGVEWVSTPGAEPACTGVPVGTTEGASGTKWSGSCSFTKAGVYAFYCTVHHAAMSGTITVGPTGTVTSTTTTTGPVTTSSGPGSGTPPPSTGPLRPTLATALVGGTSALSLSGHRPGFSVHGSLDIAKAGAGGTLVVELLGTHAALGHGPLDVGRLVRYYVAAGRQSFTIPLNARGKRALRKRGHLALTVSISLSPPGEAPLSFSRRLTLRR